MLKLDFVIDKKLLKGSHQLLKKVLLRFHWAILEIKSFEMYIFCHLMQPKDLLRLFDPPIPTFIHSLRPIRMKSSSPPSLYRGEHFYLSSFRAGISNLECFEQIY